MILLSIIEKYLIYKIGVDNILYNSDKVDLSKGGKEYEKYVIYFRWLDDGMKDSCNVNGYYGYRMRT